MPNNNNDKAKKKVVLYPGHFVNADYDLLKNTYIYVDTPGDNKFEMLNRWKTSDKGRAGRLLEDTEYNFWWSKEEREKRWVEKNLTEKVCARVKTGKVKNGVIEVQLPNKPTFAVQINDSDQATAQYVGWAPSPCKLKMVTGGTATKVVLRVKDATTGGKLSFYKTKTSSASDTLELEVPQGGTVDFLMGGKHPHASSADKDTELEVVEFGTVVTSHKLMVRIRKNANGLSGPERDRFLRALKAINTKGIFQQLRSLHRSESSAQAHGDAAFLPWHRAFILDLEREMQKTDPSVSLHYWRFDQACPNVFQENFMGKNDAKGELKFASGNPLDNWMIDGTPGIERSPRTGFDTDKVPPSVRSEADTLALGTTHASFRSMEGNPHGTAHTRWAGFLRSISTAAKDPLFFMLHCNVDRLWAKWQAQNKVRYDASTAGYDSGKRRIGHNQDDTMWPWNGDGSRITEDDGGGITGKAPRPNFVRSDCTEAPPVKPKVKDMFDYQGKKAAKDRLGFDYDDVPYTP